MGCDIHAYVECFETFGESSKSNAFLTGTEVEFFRSYMLFGILAGVRYNPIEIVSELKGIPDKLSYFVENEYNLIVVDNEYNERNNDLNVFGSEKICSLEEAEDWTSRNKNMWSGSSKWVEKKEIKFDKFTSYGRITHPDFHSASWLTLEEVQRARELYNQEMILAEQDLLEMKDEEEIPESIKTIDKLMDVARGKGYIPKIIKDEPVVKNIELQYKCKPLEIVYSMMKLHKEFGDESRFVFWFDS